MLDVSCILNVVDIWSVAFGAVALLVGVAFALIGLTPPEYKASRFCLWLAAIWLGGTAVMSIIQSDQPASRRLLIGAVVGATIGMLLPEALRMIVRREAGLTSPNTRTLPSAEPTDVGATPLTTSRRPIKNVRPTVTLTVSPPVIRAGATARLTWTSMNASEVLILPEIGFVDLNGSRDVTLTASTPFVIAAVTETGLIETSSVRVEVSREVSDESGPEAELVMVSGSITASPATMIANRPSLLRWNSFEATNVAILPKIGLVGGAGEIAVFPTETTAFTLLLWNATGGFGQGAATVQVYRWPTDDAK